MNKLNKQHLKERDEACTKVREALEQLETAVTDYNAKREIAWETLSAAVIAYNEEMQAAWGAVEAARDEYNGEALCTARDWATNVAGEIDEYVSERSDKWHETDKGQAINSWKEQFDEVSLEDVEFEMPDDIEVDEPDELSMDIENPADVLEQLPEEAEG